MANVGFTAGNFTANVDFGQDQQKVLSDLKFLEQKTALDASIKQLEHQRDNPGKNTVGTRTSLPKTGESGESGGLDGTINDTTTNLQNAAVGQGQAGVNQAESAANSSLQQMAQASQIQMAMTNATAIITMIVKFSELVDKRIKGSGDSANQMA